MPTIRRCRPMLGTFVQIEITDPALTEQRLQALADIAFGRIARVQSLMSFHDAGSELTRLNACGHLHPLAVNEWTREVIARAVALGEASHGVFDIAVASTLVRWGFLPRHQTTTPGEGATYRDIVLHDDGRIGFQCPLQLDLGGIAKGFAVDKAAEILIDAQVQSAVINAGGDLRFVGECPPMLALRQPRAPHEALLTVPLVSPAVATSAAYFANRRYHTRKVNHILHPTTRKPMRSNISVSVFAQTCVQADALTKVLLLDEPASWQSLLHKENASVVFLTSKGEIVCFPAAA